MMNKHNTPDHELITADVFEVEREGYWSCSCGSFGEIHVGSTVRPVKVSTRLNAAFAQHVRQVSA